MDAANWFSVVILFLGLIVSVFSYREHCKNSKSSCYQTNIANTQSLYSLLSLRGSEDGNVSLEEFESIVERILNCYDCFCADYLNGNIDKKRFEKNHKEDIRRLFENEHCKKKLDTRTTQYPNIVAVYDKLIKLKP